MKLLAHNILVIKMLKGRDYITWHKKFSQYVKLHLAILMFSATGITNKLASAQNFLSVKFVILYGTSLLLMFLYALAWQQFLKMIPLSAAYANRSVSMIWTMLFGSLFFQEQLTWNMLLGAAVILVGVYWVVTGNE